MKHTPLSYTILGLWLTLILTACSNGEVTSSAAQPTPTVVTVEAAPTATPTSTPFTPSATPLPLAAIVNGEEISLAEYETELARFRAESGTGLATHGQEIVLENLINQVLLAQAARESGFVVDQDTLQSRIDRLGLTDQELDDWTTAYGYSDQAFRQALTRSIEAAWMRDQIVAAVPETAEQVHARQFLLYNSDEANEVYDQLEAGTDFETLLIEYEPLTKGDLGWFPRGYLTVPELDQVLFSLEPGAYSEIIQTALGYHIIQVIEQDPDRPLSPDAYRSVQLQALEQWLDDRRSQSEIELLLP